MRRPELIFQTFVVALFVAVALAYLGANAGFIPAYGDSGDYLRLSREMTLDEYRGAGYPLLLRGLGAIFTIQGQLGSQLLVVQILQMVLYAASLGYFMRAYARSAGPSANHRGLLVIAAALLLFLDPLAVHFNLSIMTDGVALSLWLVWLASYIDFHERRGNFLPLLLFAASGFALANTRVEKTYVLLVAATLSFGVFAWQGRTLWAPQALRAGILLTVQVAIVLISLFVNAGIHHSTGRLPMFEHSLLFRVVYPNLVEIRDHLPPDVASSIAPREARSFDAHIMNAIAIVQRHWGHDEKELRRVIVAMAETAAVHRGGWIALDTLKDVSENVFATPSFFSRWALHSLLRGSEPEPASQAWLRDAVPWTVSRFSEKTPRLAGAYLILAAGLAFSSLLLAARNRPAVTLRRALSGPLVIAWTAVLANACLFGMTRDMVHPRYNMPSHFLFMFCVFVAALTVVDDTRRARGGSTRG